MNIWLLAPLFLVLQFLVPVSTRAQWVYNGTPVSTAASFQYNPKAVSDGAGGIIVTWYDYRSNIYGDIYAQRISGSGVPLWTLDGVPISTDPNGQLESVITSDGAGGAIIAWDGFRGASGYDIFAQRVDASGVTQWASNGVPVCTASANQAGQQIVADGAGGAVIAWQDLRNGGGYDIYAQRINASGVAQWTSNGVVLCAVTGDQSGLAITSDGSGGAIGVWADFRNGTNYDLYAQRVNASGIAQWTANGIAFAAFAYDQSSASIAADGSGGAIVAWNDSRNANSPDIYAQRLNASGADRWTAGGLRVCAAANAQYSPVVSSDGAGGAVVAWQDYRSAVTYDIYAQRISASGTVQWAGDGVALSIASGDQTGPCIVGDSAGGAIVAWQDYRAASGDVYAQRIDLSGTTLWAADGAPVCTSTNLQYLLSIVSNGNGGAIIAWQDDRSGTTYDIYAQRIDGRYGYYGTPEPVLSAVSDVPGDQGGAVTLDFYASGRDALNQQVISHYSIWRATDAAAAMAASEDGVPKVKLVDVGADFSGPAIREEKTTTSDYFWELVGNQSAIYRAAYSFTAPTKYDSTAASPATHQFQVVAHAYNSAYINWPSNVMSGHSVDNLAPAAPLYLTAQRVGADVHAQMEPRARSGSQGLRRVPRDGFGCHADPRQLPRGRQRLGTRGRGRTDDDALLYRHRHRRACEPEHAVE